MYLYYRIWWWKNKNIIETIRNTSVKRTMCCFKNLNILFIYNVDYSIILYIKYRVLIIIHI